MRDGRKELLALVSGHRESTESWSEVLRDLATRGLRPPVLLVGDGALGLWAALANLWPEVRAQRCWNHKVLNILDKATIRRSRALRTRRQGCGQRASFQARSSALVAR